MIDIACELGGDFINLWPGQDGYDYPLAADYLGKDLELRPGDRVVTSGLGDVFPAGVPIGVVGAVEPDSTRLFQRAMVAPYADFASLRRVFVLVPAAPEGGAE